MINEACSTSWLISSSTDSRWSASGPIGTAGPGSLSPRLAAISQTGYDGRNISRPAASARQRRPRRSGWPPHDPARDALWTDTDEQGSVSSGPRDQRIRRPKVGQRIGLAYSASASVHHDRPAAPVLLVELVDFKRHARRLSQLGQDAIRSGAEIRRAFMHRIRHRQDLRKISSLPRHTTQMMGLQEIKTLLAAQCLEVALRPVIGVVPSSRGWADHELRSSLIR